LRLPSRRSWCVSLCLFPHIDGVSLLSTVQAQSSFCSLGACDGSAAHPEWTWKAECLERSLTSVSVCMQSKAMSSYGYSIVQVLVTDILPDQKVRNAMNEINAASRLRCRIGTFLLSDLHGTLSFQVPWVAVSRVTGSLCLRC
jgi:hypothetical protein